MLEPAVESYLSIRRAAGFKLVGPARTLREFAVFSASRGEAFVRTRTVLEWVRMRSSTPLAAYMRLGEIVLFARFMRAEDPRHEVPPRDALGRHRAPRRPPYVFTPEEVGALVRAAQDWGTKGTLKPRVFSTLFGLLACTGMRISEALNLLIRDVTPDGLHIRNAKFGKSRLLPLHETTKTRLDRYIERRLQEAGGCEFLLPSVRGRKLHKNTVAYAFHRLLETLGIGPRQGRKPRIHDLRFYFANQVLTTCPSQERCGISRHMVALATYLGHSDMRDTYWYLEATPVVLAKVATRYEGFLRGDRE